MSLTGPSSQPWSLRKNEWRKRNVCFSKLANHSGPLLLLIYFNVFRYLATTQTLWLPAAILHTLHRIICAYCWILCCCVFIGIPDRSMALHYNDVIMITMACQITSLTIVYKTVYSDADQRKHQSSVSLAFVREIPAERDGNVAIFFHLMASWWRHQMAHYDVMVMDCPRDSGAILKGIVKYNRYQTTYKDYITLTS